MEIDLCSVSTSTPYHKYEGLPPLYEYFELASNLNIKTLLLLVY